MKGNLKQVYDPQGMPKKLGVPIAKPGGEGCVYILNDKPGVLVKVYHPEKLKKDKVYYQEKIGAMTELSGDFKSLNVCWPLMSVFDSSKQWIGYAMKQGAGVPMRYLAHGVAYRKHFPNLNRLALCQFLLSFLKNVKALHEKNIYIGDYNFLNFLCNPANSEVTMIDCDSYQATINGKRFPCPVGSPDLTPIEHHNKNFKDVVRTIESENFSIAIVIFECLMLGRHPYDVVDGDDPVTNLRNAKFPYANKAYGIPIGPWYNIWSHMPYKIKSLFIKIFTEGVKNPSARPSVKEWQDELSLYLAEIKKGWHDIEIIPQTAKSKEYRGSKQINNERR